MTFIKTACITTHGKVSAFAPLMEHQYGYQKKPASQNILALREEGQPNQIAQWGWHLYFYDVLNHMVIDSSIKPSSVSEHKCVAEHLEYAGKNDLIIYDRGYNAFWLYALHKKHNHAFCMRRKSQEES